MCEKDKALMKASMLAGFILSVREDVASNQKGWNKRACELADSLGLDISRIYSPLYMEDETGKITKIK